MSAKQSSTLIGQRFHLLTDGLRVAVEVLDVREAYGRTDCRVKPVAGEGEKWVSKDRLASVPERSAP